jgi:dolichyl-diphosphooligosaccharide--protein glycosyltransferase
LGILYALLGIYLFLSGIRSENKKIAALKIIFGGIIMGFGMASWGGNQFFIIPLGLFIITLPFLRKDHKFLLWSVPLFVITFLLTSGSFERPGLSFVFGMGGISLIIPTIFLVTCIFVQKISSDKNKIRNGLILLLLIIIVGFSLLAITSQSNPDSLPTFRYLNALNPFLTTTDPLTDSVAEHATTSIKESFAFHTVFLIFSGIGVWLILTKKLSDDSVILKNETKSFVLIIGMTGVYVSSAFVRLEVFASISLIILCAIGLSILTKEIFKLQLSRNRNYLLKISYSAIIVILFTIPLVIPEQNWITYGDMPATIFTGGTMNPASNDWLDSLEWVKLNTPTNAVVAAWWDYGYWISTMAERTTLADNSTLIDSRIKQIAEIFLSNPNSAWNSLNEMNVDYVMIFVSGQKFNNSEMDLPIYRLSGGGDESKIYWFAQISQQPFERYLYSDGLSGTDYYWNETLLGQLTPFSPIGYYNFENNQESPNYVDGYSQLTQKNIKYYSDEHPFKLVYASSSFTDEQQGVMSGVFVYQINKNYTPFD